MSNEKQTQSEQNQSEVILILDFGSQYTQLLAQRTRENHTFCEIIPCQSSAAEIAARRPIGVILSGGPSSVYEEGAPQVDPEIFELGVPVLGVCYGMQLICQNFGGRVTAASKKEYGRAMLELTEEGQVSALFAGVDACSQVWMSHGDKVDVSPGNFESLASTSSCPYAAFKLKDRPIYGIQFHPEVTHSRQGREIIRNFVVGVCGSHQCWTMANFIAESVDKLRAQIGTQRVICGLSGGVDSAVVAALISRAVGSQLTCICVDNGLMRKNEIESVARVFRENFDVNLIVANARERFLTALKGVTDPQEKRKIIGSTFIDVFSEEAKKIDGAKFLAQGTIYPDVIESGGAKGGQAATIKLHHNVGGLPEDLEFQLVEPLRELFKGDTRRLGLELGLPEELVWRHPFPGPGLAVRCLGEVTEENLAILREVDAIVVEEITKANLYRETSQTFAVLLPINSVGVMGDGRTYAKVVAVRSVSTVDFMTADWSRLPYDVLATISSRIINEVPAVNRVVYDISSKPPATIEWE
ncbi:MAG: glutamine-hydrolyzing GMP synthase [Planctomycetia bacterium]|nr:glutamine-hydrolyzing GMP synthase [Planctomycetia bacterium]